MEDQNVQLKLEVGGEIGAYVLNEFTLGGKIGSLTQSLKRDARVLVNVIDSDGELILSSEGWVKGVEVETVPATQAVPRYTKRKHKIRLDAPDPE